jgi:hypothetical protein
MAELFVVKDQIGLYLRAEDCPLCGNDEQLLAGDSNGMNIFRVKCLRCYQIIGLCAIRGSELVYMIWGSEDDVLKAWAAEQRRRIRVRIRYIDDFSTE